MSDNIPDLTLSSSGPSSQSSLCNSADEVDWRERCQVLEVSLVKFKQKAARIRELLSEKMQDMECRVHEADERAAEAEEKCKSLAVRLFGLDSNQTKMEMEKQLEQLEADCQDKDLYIATLQCQLEEQRQLRLQEARLVEEKSAKIREWVTRKVQEMESHNHLLMMEKMNLKDQVNSLNFQLECLKVANHSQKQFNEEKKQKEASSTSAVPQLVTAPTSSSLSFSIAHQDPDDEFQLVIAKDQAPGDDDTSRFSGCNDYDDVAFSNDYVEVNGNREEGNREEGNRGKGNGGEGKYRAKQSVPQIEIKRKVFPGLVPPSSMISSSNDSHELLNLDVIGQLSSHSSFDAPVKGEALTAADALTPVTLTPKEPHSPLTPFLPDVPPNSPLPGGSFYTAQGSQVVSAVATMPRRKKDPEKFLTQVHHNASSKYGPLTISRNYKKVYDPTRIRPKPPTPPVRRVPSWEGRIYAVAASGIEMEERASGLCTVEASRSAVSRDPSPPAPPPPPPGHIYEGLAVPVYAMLRGRAAQIRSSPFTGESSSDSSDVEVEPNRLKPGLVTSKWSPNEQVMENGLAGGGILKQPTTCGRKRTTTGEASSLSIASDTSSDYALPPDDAMSVKTDSSDTCEPEQKLIKYTMDSFRKGNHEKSGFLSKLGGKVKCWQRRWFVLRNGELLYYKSPNEMSQKSRGHIILDESTQVQRLNNLQTFEVVTSKRTYYLAADTADDAEQWIRVLLNVLHRQATDSTAQPGCAKETVSGWLVKTKNGRRKRCWCVLVEKIFIYYRSPADQTPLGQINLRDARIEEIDRSCETDSDSDIVSHSADYTLAIWPPNDGPTYLLIPVKQKKDSWLYHLTVACGGGLGKVGTDYEQLIAKLMAVEGEVGASFWKDPVLLYTREPLVRSLITLPSEDLQKKALELFKQCHSFTHTPIESSQLDVHVMMVQSILSQCLQLPELQTELFCQLVKQTSRHPHQHKYGVQNFLLCGSHSWFQCDSSPTSPTNSIIDLSDSKLNPTPHVLVQGWQLLTMAVSLFVPKQSVLWYLRIHLQRNADTRTEAGKYAIFCQCALERTLQNGPRERRPSRMEILSILLRNPYHHSQPISIPVHFVNGSYQVISFDGSTTVQEFLQSLNKAINVRDCALSGFALFTDDPNNAELEHCLKMHFKLCDVISKWEQTLPVTVDRGRFDVIRTIKLTYKNRLYYKSMTRMETERERLLLAYQANEEIIAGRFPLSRDLAIELMALMAQIDYSDIKPLSEMALVPTGKLFLEKSSPQHSPQLLLLAQILERFYPNHYRCSTDDSTRSLEQKLIEKWTSLKGKLVQDCIRVYLAVTRKWTFFGSKLFSAKMKGQITNSGEVWLAVSDDGIAILDYVSLTLIKSFMYSSIVTFGGCRDDFMLVIDDKKKTVNIDSRSQRLLFIMSKPKVLEATLLIATYINSRSQQMAAPDRCPQPVDHAAPRIITVQHHTVVDHQK